MRSPLSWIMDSGFGFPCRNVPKKAIRKMCNEGERPKARKVLSVENLIADLDLSVLERFDLNGDREFICDCGLEIRERA